MAQDVLADAESLRHLTAYDRNGIRIGAVGDVYLEDLHRRPEWVTVRMDEDVLSSGETFVPLEGATVRRGGVLDVACTREAVRSAPRMEAEQHLDLVQEQELYRHYGIATPAEEASGAPGVGDGRPKWPVAEGEADIEDFEELAGETAAASPRLRRYVPGEEI